MATIFNDILKNVFPKGYCFVFAYGSNVFKQLGNNSKGNMIDFIIAVENPAEWHRMNIQRNSSHYSLLKYCGPEYLSKIQDCFGAKVYFNTLIPTHAGLIKYGVISKDNLISDLLDWETLYLSGRLHKPVNMLYKETDEELNTALKINLYAAIHTSLLLLPETFTEQDLYHSIASLSYAGDFRMIVGENKNKISNIVGGQMNEFRKLYLPILQEMRDYVIVDYGRASGQQDVSPSTKFFHLSMLPKMLQYEIVSEWNKDGRSRDLEDVLRAAALDPDSHDIVLKGVQEIVQSSSISQSIKGILTAGPVKSFKYSLSKIKKMYNSLER